MFLNHGHLILTGLEEISQPVKITGFQAPNVIHIISRRMRVVVDDETESETVLGDCEVISPEPTLQ
jgi:hypothetical protein